MIFEALDVASNQLILKNQRQPSHAVDVEVVVGLERISELLESMTLLAQCELVGMHPGIALSPEELGNGIRRNRELLDRGVSIRSIHMEPMTRVPHGAVHVQQLVECGVQVRLANSLPFRLIVADRYWAMVPISPVDGELALMLLRGGPLVNLLCDLFEHAWLHASPVNATTPVAEGASPTPQQRLMLKAMAAGYKDDTVARELGVSTRTYRRLIADLLRVLGVESRFQAGAQAMRLGWLD
ncbi:LuxR C-terminal-related transcriptional regulator [Streptomyces sp. NPDC002076]